MTGSQKVTSSSLVCSTQKMEPCGSIFLCIALIFYERTIPSILDHGVHIAHFLPFHYTARQNSLQVPHSVPKKKSFVHAAEAK